MELFRKMFGYEKPNTTPALRWGINKAYIRSATVTLKGIRRSMEVKELAFILFIVIAKQQGWSGGDRFFAIKGDQGFNIPLRDGMSIVGEEAASLGQAFQRQKQEMTPLSVEFIALCKEGGFEIIRNYGKDQL
jgi:hypothetical protein